MSVKGKPGEWFENEHNAGYFDDHGNPVVVTEFGSDRDLGTHDIDVQNGHGWYNDEGTYVRPEFRDQW